MLNGKMSLFSCAKKKEKKVYYLVRWVSFWIVIGIVFNDNDNSLSLNKTGIASLYEWWQE